MGPLRLRIGALLFACTALAVVGAACNDDDGGDPPAGTPTSAASNVTPQDPAIIDGRTFISVASGYRVEFPEGWSPDDNFLYTPQNVIDVFFAPEGTAEVQANIQVRCDREDALGLTAEAYLDARRQVAEGFATGEITESAATVAGQAAVRLEYQQRPGGTTTVEKTDIILFGNGCGWTLSLTEDPGEDRSAEFDTMVASFTFVD